MKKSTLNIIYFSFVLVMLSLFISTSFMADLGKLFLLVILSYMLFNITMEKREYSVFHHFNIIFAILMSVFVIYVLLFQGILFLRVRVEFLALSLIGFALSLIYSPQKKIVSFRFHKKPSALKKKVIVRKVKRSATKLVIKKPVIKKNLSKKVLKKSTTKKVTKKKVAKKRVMKRKGTKKKITLSKKRVSPKRTLKKNPDKNMISFNQDYEVAYVLRKFNKRITKSNKEKIVGFGKKFKLNKSFKPHSRESFYLYVKKNKVLSKLD